MLVQCQNKPKVGLKEGVFFVTLWIYGSQNKPKVGLKELISDNIRISVIMSE